MVETSATLLAKVKDPKDGEAWRRFDGIYRPLVSRWVRGGGVPRHDVEEVAQTVLVAVQHSMSSGFEYDPSRGFRKYLSTVVRSKVAEYFRQLKRRGPHVPVEEADAAGDDPADAIWEEQYREHLLTTLLGQVRAEVDDETWAIFTAYRVEKESAKSVAQRHGITPQAVANRAFRVLEKVRAAAGQIDPDFWPD